MNRTRLFLLGLILAFAAAVRVYSLSGLGFWTDELGALSASHGWGLAFADVPVDRVLPTLPRYTRLADARPWTAVVPGLVRDESHPPVYFLLLRGWQAAFGDGEAVVRSLNVCLSLVAIGLLYAAAAPGVGPAAALWACLLMAVASPQVQFAQEARNYMPGLTASLAAAVAAGRLVRRSTAGRAAVYAVALLGMMLTHYFTAGVAVALTAWMVATLRGRPRRLAVTATVAAAAAFAVLWGPAVWRQLPNFHANYQWLTDAGPGRGRRLLVRLCQATARLVAEGPPTACAAAGGVGLLLLPFAAARPSLRLWVAWLVLTLGGVAALDAARSTTQLTLTRYTLFATPAAYVLIAAAVRGRWSWVAPAAATVLAVVALPAAYVPAWKIDLRTPAQIVGRQIGPADGLVISGPDRVFASVTFAAFQEYLPRLPDAVVLLTRPADEATLARLRQCPRVWVVWLWPDRPIAAFLPGYRTAQAGQLPSFGEIATGRISPAARR